MPLEKLSRTEIAQLKGTGPDPIIAAYAAFLGRLSIGEGGKAIVADEKATRFTVKKRVQTAADGAGIYLKWFRTPPEVLMFEVVDAAHAPKRPGRQPKAAA
jgi:hypothetical protein